MTYHDQPVFGQAPSAAAWIAPRLSGRVGQVSGTVPAGFECYVRILHPVEVDEAKLMTWSEFAASSRRGQIHSLVQWNRLGRNQGNWRSSPETGSLVSVAFSALLRILEKHTATPSDCWFCYWDGYDWLRGTYLKRVSGESQWELALGDELLDPSLLVELPMRQYMLGRGPLKSALRVGDSISLDDTFVFQSPNLFWPSDRAWCVATEVDFDSTIVGGEASLAASLLASIDLECLPVTPVDSLAADADKINL